MPRQPKTTHLIVDMPMPLELLSSQRSEQRVPVEWAKSTPDWLVPEKRGPKRQKEVERVATEIEKLGDAFPGTRQRLEWAKVLCTSPSTLDRALKKLGRPWRRVVKI
jgi:hypothetical protein